MKKNIDKQRVSKEDLEFAKAMGKRIRQIRRSQKPKMTIAKLAEKADLSDVTVSNIETGNIPLVSIGTIRRIAKALNCPVFLLTGESDTLKTIEMLRDFLKSESMN